MPSVPTQRLRPSYSLAAVGGVTLLAALWAMSNSRWLLALALAIGAASVVSWRRMQRRARPAVEDAAPPVPIEPLASDAVTIEPTLRADSAALGLPPPYPSRPEA